MTSAAAILSITACAPALTSEISQVNLRFIDNGRELASSLTSSAAPNSNGGMQSTHSALKDSSGTEIALSADYCYGIMVSALDTPSLNRYSGHDSSKNTGTDEHSLLCKKYEPNIIGAVNGLYKIGDDATLKVPTGKDRMFLMIMIAKGIGGIPATCTGALDIRVSTGDDGPSIFVDNKELQDAKVKFLAYGQATLSSGTNTVDMQLLNKADGLKCDDGGGTGESHSYVETFPWIDQNLLRVSPSLLATGAHPFLTARCPDDYEVALSGPNYYAFSECSDGPLTFKDLVLNNTYTLHVYDNSGSEIVSEAKTFVVQQDGISYATLRDAANPNNDFTTSYGASRALAMRQPSGSRTQADIMLNSSSSITVNPVTQDATGRFLISDASAQAFATSPRTPLDNAFLVDSDLKLALKGSTSFAFGSLTNSSVAANSITLGNDVRSRFLGDNLTSISTTKGFYSLYATAVATPYSPELFLFNSFDLVNATYDTIVLPNPPALVDAKTKIWTRLSSDGTPVIIVPMGNDGGTHNPEIQIFRCSGPSHSCVASGNPLEWADIKFLSPAVMTSSRSYQAIPYTRLTNDGRENRLAVFYLGASGQYIPFSISVDKLQFGADLTTSENLIDASNSPPNYSMQGTAMLATEPAGQFYPSLFSDAGTTVDVYIQALASFDPNTDFTNGTTSVKVQNAWGDQLVLGGYRLIGPHKYSFIYRSPDGGRNWYQVYTGASDTVLTSIITTLSPYFNTSSNATDYYPSFLTSESTGSSVHFLLQQNTGF